MYGDDRESLWAVVDEEDYHFLVKYRWCPNVKKSRRNPLKTKTYLRRSIGENQDGQRLRTFSVYLHIEIMKRTGILPPSPAHIITDHRDGDTMNCRRSNLRWATHSMNSRNLFGCEPYDLEELMNEKGSQDGRPSHGAAKGKSSATILGWREHREAGKRVQREPIDLLPVGKERRAANAGLHLCVPELWNAIGEAS